MGIHTHPSPHTHTFDLYVPHHLTRGSVAVAFVGCRQTQLYSRIIIGVKKMANSISKKTILFSFFSATVARIDH